MSDLQAHSPEASGAPAATRRPRWALWVADEGLGWREAADLIGVSFETARRMGLPWDHPKRSKPTVELAAYTQRQTGGAVVLTDWLPPGDGSELTPARQGSAS